MEALHKQFPQSDFALIAIVLLLPAIGAFVNGVFGKRLGKDAVRLMALSAIGGSFLASILTFVMLPHEGKLSWMAWRWMSVTGRMGQTIPVDVKFSVDAMTATMMLVVTGVGFLIHLYSSEYMRKDPGYHRFFSYLNLFCFSMLVLITADNLPLLFVGWEGVGMCSYLLIGFWFTEEKNAKAGKKAFVVNRIGDFGLIVAMCLLFYYVGSIHWDGIEKGASALLTPVKIWPIGNLSRETLPGFLGTILIPDKPVQVYGATLVGLALFLGCAGKSAQIPLYVWLPDAMAGPTPVSALIHAATMVTAGVYLVARMHFVFILSPAAMAVVAVTGVCTALLAASIGLFQHDLKKVLAYSTVSQLGFMFIGVGVGAFAAGFFHVFTHAFFKACLFLGAGSVIHAMHARIHDDVKSQDMRNMGGLRKYMPYTFWTFGAATLAIIGFPLTSGFFSKDEILFKAFVNHPVNAAAAHMGAKAAEKLWQQPTWIGPVLWAMGLATAVLTAFYMSRAFILTFFGDFKGWTIGKAPAAEHHGHDDHDDHGDDDEDHHHEEDLKVPGPAPHESPWQMTVPLMILATLSLAGGFLNPGLFAGLFKDHKPPMEHWLEPVFEEAEKAIQVLPNAEAAHHKEYPLTAAAFAAFAVGTFVAYQFYIAKKGQPAKDMAEKAPGLHKLLVDKWRVDEFYDATVWNGVDALADTAISVDQSFFDAIIARLTALVVAALGTVLRVFQNGVVHVYAGAMALGIVLIGWFVVVPRADVSTRATGNGDYVLEAAPGMGYGYRWTPEASGKPQDEKFSPASTQLKVHLDADKTQTVKLEVKNAFGFQASREVTLKGPTSEKPEKLGSVDLPSDNLGKN